MLDTSRLNELSQPPKFENWMDLIDTEPRDPDPDYIMQMLKEKEKNAKKTKS